MHVSDAKTQISRESWFGVMHRRAGRNVEGSIVMNNLPLDGHRTPAPGQHLVSFHRLIPNARMPQRADRSAAGSLPTRAFRYCEPATSASAFGYYIFPPISFSLQWDGHDMLWTWEGAPDCYPLKSAQFPGFREQFDAVAPAEIREFSPPFLGALQEPGLVQL